MGGFHTEKITLAWLGKYLEKTGITEIFRPGTVKSVSNRGHYFPIETGGVFLRSLELFVNQGVSTNRFNKEKKYRCPLRDPKSLEICQLCKS